MGENIRHATQKPYQKALVDISNYNEEQTAETVTVRKMVIDCSKDILNNEKERIVTVTLNGEKRRQILGQ